MTKFVSACFLAACLAIPASAAAGPITYTASRPVGTGSVNLSITTDGTVGVLGNGNILDWLITMTIGPDSFTLRGPLSGNNSGLSITGTSLIGSLANLIFDYSAGGMNYALFQSPTPGSGSYFWCPQTNGCYDFSGPGEGINPYNFFTFTDTNYQGREILATAAVDAAPVPEPGTMSLLALGGAAIAWRLRRRQRSA